MVQMINDIQTLSIEQREEVFFETARALEHNARVALVEGDKQFAQMSSNMADAIRINADELAREDIDTAQRVLLEANAIIERFNVIHPYRMLSAAIH